MEYNIQNIKKQFKEKGIFYTQPELALYMKSLIDIEITDVYDPTCGSGSLLSCFSDDLPKFGQEINEHQLVIASNNLKNFTGAVGDTLKDPAFIDKRFSCIMANPPFSISWDPPLIKNEDKRFAPAPTIPTQSKADFAFLLHILHLLADDGVAIVLNFPGILYRSGREAILRKWFVNNNWIDKIISVPGKTFIDTTISTAIIIFKKNRITTNVEFIDNELELSRIVSIEEIEDNDYTLSVSTYVQKPEEKVDVNPLQLQDYARNGMLKKIKNDIEIDKIICEMEGYNFDEYLQDILDLINSYRNE